MDDPVCSAPGELVSANGSCYHVRQWGVRGPLIVLECGLTMMSSCWARIAPALAAFSRVLAYDRAGLGWSAERDDPRDAGQIAIELDGLLRSLGVNEPMVLLGHSMGALFHRGFLRLRPGTARALVWLDPAHPEQTRQPGIRKRIRHLLFYIEAAQVLARRGVPAIEVPLIRHLAGLPAEDYQTLRHFMRSATHLETCAREGRAWSASGQFVNGSHVRDVPLLLLSGRKSALPGWESLQKELAALSTRTRHLTLNEMSHISMLTDPGHVQKVAAEIRGFLENLPASSPP